MPYELFQHEARVVALFIHAVFSELLAEAEMRRAVQTDDDALDDRAREVLESRFGLGGRTPMSLAQIGSRLGVSRERVRQLERRALERLRAQVR